jgi:murein DD-endopeptidase MepM/ murein hydrolase activator NlpD
MDSLIKKLVVLFLGVAIFFVAFFLLVKKSEAPTISQQSLVTNSSENIKDNKQQLVINDQEVQKKQTIEPLSDPLPRITKKPFGILINSKTSPVQPERFAGYHTGTDLETTPGEQNIDVPVVALCDGKLLMARSASGYGGVMVQSCNLNGQGVTVIYGHIRLASVKYKVSDQIKTGDFLANLGTGYSNETDGERKHLHLAIHSGNLINILGYVQSKGALNGWIDPKQFL